MEFEKTNEQLLEELELWRMRSTIAQQNVMLIEQELKIRELQDNKES